LPVIVLPFFFVFCVVGREGQWDGNH